MLELRANETEGGLSVSLRTCPDLKERARVRRDLIANHNTSNFTAKPGLDGSKRAGASEQGPFDNTKIGFAI